MIQFRAISIDNILDVAVAIVQEPLLTANGAVILRQLRPAFGTNSRRS
jgi:hypothetical protein